ncbi:MAG: amidohydrolase family protein [Sphingomicrobium sp.]
MIEKLDAHHHLWSVGSPHYPMMGAPDTDRYIGNTGRLKHEFGAVEYKALAATRNVTRSVYVESAFVPHLEETAFVQAIADEHGFPSAIISRADLASPDLSRDLDIHMRSALFRGLRLMANWDEDPAYRGTPDPHLLDDPAWRRGYAELGERGLVAEVMVFPRQLTALARLAEELPDTRLVIGHGGIPLARTAAEVKQWHDGMAALARLPHLDVKISGLGMADHRWTLDGIRPLVERLIALFGPSRAMFASNWPVDALYSSWDMLWDAFDTITADLPEPDRAALFRGTAMRVYSIV